MRIPSLVLLVLLVGLPGCKTIDQHVGSIFSPDRSLKVELRKCFNHSNGSFTQITIVKSDKSTRCHDLRNGLAGFSAPSDLTNVDIRWTSNDTLEVSYPEHSGRKFPYISWGFSRSGEQEVLN